MKVRAWLAFGWEGDNFLFDSERPAPRKTADLGAASVWFYCKPDREPSACNTILDFSPVLGTHGILPLRSGPEVAHGRHVRSGAVAVRGCWGF